MTSLKHWRLETDKNHITWLGFDREESSVNTINDEVLDELSTCLDNLDGTQKGLVIYSCKKKGFIAGADVNHFSKFSESETVLAFLKKGHAVLNKLEGLSMPTVAMIDGFCMGGGYELALACDYRIASSDDGTQVGLPEILLGIYPGWGGTIRLPKLIGGFKALTQVILTGRAFRASRAKKVGLVDEAVPKRQLKRAVEYFIDKKPQPKRPSFWEGLSNQSWLKPILAYFIKQQVAKKVNSKHYPAPFAAIENWLKQNGKPSHDEQAEISRIAKLITENDTAKNLIRAFFLKEQLKSLAKESSFKAQHVHVVGAGTMGGDIAAWCALRGIYVTLQDRAYENIAPAIKRAYRLFKKKLKKPYLVQAAMDRLSPDPSGAGVAQADVIIEAIFEDLKTKQTLFKEIEQRAKPNAILATNTSSIPLDEISDVLESPSRLVGIHFFNPVAKMQLVEVVYAEKTDFNIVKDAYAFVGQISRLPLPVKSSPGFLVNRVLMPYLLECVSLVEDGYQPEAIDKAAKHFGMMMGPVELADTVGLDVCLAVAKNLSQHFNSKVPDKLQELVSKGLLGKKSGEGFYVYKKNKPVKKSVAKTDNELIANRLILRMLNEAFDCLNEQVVDNAELLDAAMIFGTGFAPFRGGPMHYAKDFGKDKLNHLFKELEQKYGERFKLDDKTPV